MDVSVRKLKDNLSEYLRRVQDGEQVTVTDHGRPVAALIGVARKKDSPEARLAQLELAGEVTSPDGTRFTEVRRLRIRGKSVASTILSDRG